MKRSAKIFLSAALILAFSFTHIPLASAAKRYAKKKSRTPFLTAKAVAIVDSTKGTVLYSKNPHLRLPPASTTKLMTALIALEHLPLGRKVTVSPYAASMAPSKAGLTIHATYRVSELIVATLVSSSNDAAVALAQAAAGSEEKFVRLMNAKAKALGMSNTYFANATGLPAKDRKQFSTAYDLTRLIRYAMKDKRIDYVMGITMASFRGSDGKRIVIKSHNKMLWRTPKFVKGKTGWTYASRHTFVGTNYAPHKKIYFAMLSSKKPWLDIERLATFGLFLKSRN